MNVRLGGDGVVRWSYRDFAQAIQVDCCVDRFGFDFDFNFDFD